jgi:hypothetical protein
MEVFGYSRVECSLTWNVVAQGGGENGPTRDAGGFIDNYDDFYNFMVDKAKNSPVEVAAFSLDDGRYYVQPWAGNSKKGSQNFIYNIPGYSYKSVLFQYHTHPSTAGPSFDDAKASQEFNRPVRTIGPDGRIFEVYYPNGNEGTNRIMIPLPPYIYGTRIY